MVRPSLTAKRRRQIFLDRDIPIESEVARPIGDAKATFAKDRSQLIATQDGAAGKPPGIAMLGVSAGGFKFRHLPS